MTKVQSYFFEGQILKLLGNIYLSTDNFEEFEMNNFYDKIIYLIKEFNLDENNHKIQNIYFDYFETILWLINLFIQEDEKLEKNYHEKLLWIIPYILNDIKILSNTKTTDLFEILETLTDINQEFITQIVDARESKF